MSAKHTYLNHTADIALDIEADSIEELFIESFNCWLDSVVENITQNAEQIFEIKLSAGFLEQLLVEFLNEVNFHLTVNKILFVELHNLEIDKEKISLKALMKGEKFKKEVILKEEIKSVTYHQMQIRKENDKYFVRIVFDI